MVDPGLCLSGCDSGFGHALAMRLSEEGLTVFAGVLDADGAGAQSLRERGHKELHVLQLDVTDDSQLKAAHRFISAQVENTGTTKMTLIKTLYTLVILA